MFGWLRRRKKAHAPVPPLLQNAMEVVCRHVQSQVSAFEERSVERVPDRGRTNDMLIGAYVWGLLDGYLHNCNADREWAGDESAEGAIFATAVGVFERLFGRERSFWLRSHLPQWGGPWPAHASFRRALWEMRESGAADSRSLATGDPLAFARAGSLLGFLLLTTKLRPRSSAR